MQFSDRVTGICLALLGALALYGGSLQPGVPGQDVGPSVFPMVIGAGLLACGVLVAFGVGRSFEEAVTLIPAAPGQEPARPPAFGELRAFLPPPPGTVDAGSDDAALTPAERDVLRLVARGLDNRTIAERLGKSEKTVRNQVSSIFDKLGVKSRAEAIVHVRDRAGDD